MAALWHLERELKGNSALKGLLEERQRMPECRRLPLESFLGRPRTRFGKYVTVRIEEERIWYSGWESGGVCIVCEYSIVWVGV